MSGVALKSIKIDEIKLLKVMAKGGTKVVLRKCIIVQTLATRRAPVDTGRLQASIVYVVEPTDDMKRVRGFVGTNVEYAPDVEFGTFRMAAQPYLRPSLAQARNA